MHLLSGSNSALLSRYAVKEVIFSRGTYQILVVEKSSKKKFWPFLQLGEKGVLLDHFCQCEESEKGLCPHLTVAYHEIVKKGVPLHIRFYNSFYCKLGEGLFEKFGADNKSIKVKDLNFFFKDKELFLLEAADKLTYGKLKEIFSLKKETEETSLKFSNLPLSEIKSWKEGRGSFRMRFELCFWSDLAKFLFLQAERLKKVEFVYDEDKLPTGLRLCFSKLKLSFAFDGLLLDKIIPFLNDIPSPLKLFDLFARRIEYDEREEKFSFYSTKLLNSEEETALVRLNGWLYLKDKGFYGAEDDALFQKETVEKDKIAVFLDKHCSLLNKYLKGIKIVKEPTPLKFFLEFDKQGNLKIESYLFQKGDLKAPFVSYFKNWIYLNKVFYKLAPPFFGKEKVILCSDVSTFVSSHKDFLSQFDGFQIHLGSLKSSLDFKVESEGLKIDLKVDFLKEIKNYFDFREWIYIEGQGFYPKKGESEFPFKVPLYVEKEKIQAFILGHEKELKEIDGFFTNGDFVERLGLKIYLNENNSIIVEPDVRLKEGYDRQKLLTFGEFIYYPEFGFYRLLALPYAYRNKEKIAAGREELFLNEIHDLQKYILEIDPRLKKPEELYLNVKKAVLKKKGVHEYYLIDFSYRSEVGFASVMEIYQALSQKKKYAFTRAGLVFLNDTRFFWLKNLNKRRFLKSGFIKLFALEWIRISIFETISLPEGNSREEEKTREILKKAFVFKSESDVELFGFKSVLRSYQVEGLKWLWFLYVHGLAGLLCDEMGLGKTHQAMALISAVKAQDMDGKNKYLIVCPTSVIYHWQELLERYLSLKVNFFHGLTRQLTSNFDVLLTSYGILRMDAAKLKKIKFEVAIFDEMQIAKNYFSITNRSLRSIHANMKLGLTGTPMENHLKELKALFDVVLPNYLPQDHIFKSEFIIPIEKQKDEKKKKLFISMVQPFILRRKKEDVLRELPEKIEEVVKCAMSEEQKELYREQVGIIKERLEKELQDKSRPIPYVHVFALFTRLKRICDHPSIALNDIDNWQHHFSGKWELFEELFSETQDSGQKLVVFSQYLQMLDIIERFLKKKKVGYASIRGSTKDRQVELKRFKEDPNCKVFVASLLAAGVGIDLSQASVVIHYDRWWNPAKENQATDRVHRIGQKRGVQVFKLVTKNSIEEHVDTIIERKKELFKDVIEKEERDALKFLSREELLLILDKISKDV